MIHESYPWKLDLRRRLRLIEKYNNPSILERDDDTAYTVLEKGVFYSAFIIRKLIECVKLSDDAEKYNFHSIAIKPKKHIDRMHHLPKEDTYDWDGEVFVTVSGRDLCNWLIHSYVFFFESDENGKVCGFYISSDYDRNKILYRIALHDWINYMKYIASDDVIELSMHFDSKANDYIATCKKRGTR